MEIDRSQINRVSLSFNIWMSFLTSLSDGKVEQVEAKLKGQQLAENLADEWRKGGQPLECKIEHLVSCVPHAKD